MIKDKIFVIVPVYNVEQYLERCVNSLLNQTYSNYEIVLVDDGSTDSSSLLCDELSMNHSNITVIHKENGGLSSARNTGIEYAVNQGFLDDSWIAFIDSDDYIHPEFLSSLFNAVVSSDFNICACTYVKTSTFEIKDCNSLNEYEVLSPEDFWCKDRTLALIVVNKIYRVRCLENIRYPEGKLHEDEFTTYKVLFNEKRVAVIWEPLYYYYFNPKSITHMEWTPKRLAGLDAYDEQLEYFEEHHYDKAYRLSLAALCEHSIKHVKYIKMQSPKYDYLLKDVKKRRNSALKEYGKRYGQKEEFRIWYQYSIRNPIKKALNNESVFSFIKRQIKRRLLHK